MSDTVYKVWCAEEGTDESSAVLIPAQSAERAVEIWAEMSDSCDPWIKDERSVVVHVRTAPGYLGRFIVSGCTVVNYSASLLSWGDVTQND